MEKIITLNGRLKGSLLWSDRTFLCVALSRFFTGTAATAVWVVLMWLGYELTGTASGTGLLLILSSLPTIVMNPFAGALADRVSKRNLLFLARIFTSALLMGFFIAYSWKSLAFLYALVLVLGATASFLYGPFDAYLVELFDLKVFPRVNARLQSVRSLSFFIGPVVGGGMMALGLRGELFFACAAVMAASAFPLLFLPVGALQGREKSRGAEPRDRFTRDLKMGFIYLRECPTCRFLLMFFASFFGIYCLTSGIWMPYCEEVLGPPKGVEGSTIYSAMDAAVGLSGFLGAFFIPWLMKRLGQVGALYLGVGLSAVELLVMGFLPNVLTVVGTLSITGISAPLLMVPMVSMVQEHVKPAFTGRIFNGIDTAVNAVVLLSYGLGGLLSERIGVLRLFLFSGFLLVGLLLVLLLLPGCRLMRKVGVDNSMAFFSSNYPS